jgi:hypothetical protein
MSRRYSKRMSSFHDEEIMDDPLPDSSTSRRVGNIPPPEDEDAFDRQYDLTPVAAKQNRKKGKKKNNKHPSKHKQRSSPVSYPVDPWETESSEQTEGKSGEVFFPSTFSNDDSDSVEIYDDQYTEDDEEYEEENRMDGPDAGNANTSARSTFLMPSDIHPRMEGREDDIAQLRLLAGKLNADWGGQDFMAPALARRIRDFQFAQEKRRKKYGDEKPWGILGLYDHLASIR